MYKLSHFEGCGKLGEATWQVDKPRQIGGGETRVRWLEEFKLNILMCDFHVEILLLDNGYFRIVKYIYIYIYK